MSILCKFGSHEWGYTRISGKRHRVCVDCKKHQIYGAAIYPLWMDYAKYKKQKREEDARDELAFDLAYKNIVGKKDKEII